MDTFEFAFVVDYLRDWAIKLNRIVILATSPSSFEILLMFSQCALLTSGRVVYMGIPSQMLQYFESIAFPCPKFKNPCDFYVDLATHDHQSPAAAAESTARIARLVQCWEQHKPSIPVAGKATVSPTLCPPTMIASVGAIFRRNWYVFANNPLSSLSEALVSLLMSLIIGGAFYSLTRDKRASQKNRRKRSTGCSRSLGSPRRILFLASLSGICRCLHFQQHSILFQYHS